MAALITADADATIAADVITDVDVTVDGDFQAEIIPAVISSGSSSFCACAETITADATMAAADVATVTTAGLYRAASVMWKQWLWMWLLTIIFCWQGDLSLCLFIFSGL